MRYRLRTLLYVVTLLAASFSVAGAFGILIAGVLLIIWRKLYRKPADQPITRYAVTLFATAGLTAISLGIGLFTVCNSLTVIGHSYFADHRCEYAALECVAAIEAFRKKHDASPLVGSLQAGQPPQSWRALILASLHASTEGPFVAGNYRYDQPWDSAANTSLASHRGFDFYRCAGLDKRHKTAENVSHFFRVQAADDPTRDAGPTPLVIEAAGRDVVWNEPVDLSLEEAVELLTTDATSVHPMPRDSYFSHATPFFPERTIAYWHRGDGRASDLRVRQFADPADARKLLMHIDDDELREQVLGRQREQQWKTQWKWGRIYGCLALAAITAAPAWDLRAKRRGALSLRGGGLADRDDRPGEFSRE